MAKSEKKTPVEQTVDLLEELLTWTKVGMYEAVEKLLTRQFGGDNARPEELLAYELLDGTRQQQEIVDICKTTVGKEARISQPTLSNWITKWDRLGLIKKEGMKATRLFFLADFGFMVPEPKDIRRAPSGDD